MQLEQPGGIKKEELVRIRQHIKELVKHKVSVAQSSTGLNPTAQDTFTPSIATSRHMDTHTCIHMKVSTSGISVLEAALSQWEEVRVKALQSPNREYIKVIFVVSPRACLLARGLLLLRCVFT